MKELMSIIPEQQRGLVERVRQPTWVEPMLATLTENYFSDPDWIFEPKLDGIRCLAFKTGDKVKLLSRNRLSLNDRFPSVVDSVGSLDVEDCILDGEIAVVSKGVSRFQSLQRHLLDGGGELVFFVFDAPHLLGHDISKLPVVTRKALLSATLQPRAGLELVSHREASGETFLEEACAKGWEGLIAKRADAPYVNGRSKAWLKFKCSKEQEFVIGGFTDPQGSRVGFGALLVGYYDPDGTLNYAGKVGTGYNRRLLLDLTEKLMAIERPDSPFAGKPPVRKNVHWVEPRIVAQIGFAEWTRDDRLRHPRFLGLRDDKDPRSVVRE